MTFKRYNRYNKKQCQEWWKNLTPEQQDNYIEQQVHKKREKRRKKEERESQKLVKLKEYKGKFCSNCFHKKTKSCDGLDEPEKSVCKYWHIIKHI